MVRESKRTKNDRTEELLVTDARDTHGERAEEEEFVR
jgi:hypothetical protein